VSYNSQANLSKDPDFQHRIEMCIAEQAEVFVGDARPEYKGLAFQAVSALETTTAQFVPLVAMRPGITDESVDGDILAAVQFLWPTIGARYVPVGVDTIGIIRSA
jgi:hypothetical protein